MTKFLQEAEALLGRIIDALNIPLWEDDDKEETEDERKQNDPGHS